MENHSIDSINKMKKAKIGNNNPSYGTYWISNEKINQKIHKEDLIPNG